MKQILNKANRRRNMVYLTTAYKSAGSILDVKHLKVDQTQSDFLSGKR